MVNQTAVQARTAIHEEDAGTNNVTDLVVGLTCDHLKVHADSLDMYDENGTTVNSDEDQDEREGEFDWSPKDKGVILGSFFWGYVLTQMPGF